MAQDPRVKDFCPLEKARRLLKAPLGDLKALMVGKGKVDMRELLNHNNQIVGIEKEPNIYHRGSGETKVLSPN